MKKAEELFRYKYYLTQRPIGIGAFPNKFVMELHEYDHKQFVDEIKREAYGYVVYSEELSNEDVNDYELTLGEKKVSNNIFTRLVNTEENEAFLQSVPHRAFLDLSIVYELYYPKTNESITITNLDGANEEDLYKSALENQERLFPTKIKAIPQKDNEIPMYVITKEIDASAILFTEKVKELSKKLESDLYIFPLSAAEMLITPKDKAPDAETVKFLMKFIKDNNLFTARGATPSSHIYLYSRKKDKIIDLG